MFARCIIAFLLLTGVAFAKEQTPAPLTLAEQRANAVAQPQSQQQQAPRQPQGAPSSQVKGSILAYQQLGLSLEIMVSYYEAQLQELRKLCGDPCNNK